MGIEAAGGWERGVGGGAGGPQGDRMGGGGERWVGRTQSKRVDFIDPWY